MWLSLVGALLALLLFGSKVLSFASRAVLLAIHKAGLFSNVQVNNQTTLQITVQAVHIRVWRNAWKFVQSPTHHPLVTVDVAGVHLVVVLCDEHAKTSKNLSHSGWQWSELDTSTSLSRLDHPKWKQVRLWMHQLPFVRFLLPVVGITFSDIDVDIVRNTQTAPSSILRLQRGCVSVGIIYKMNQGEIDLSMRVCRDEPAVITLPDCGASATFLDLRIEMSIPISCGLDDVRAPLPSSLRIHCSEVGCSIDLVGVVKRTRQSRQHHISQNEPHVGAQAAVAVGSNDTFTRAIISSKGLLLLRLVQLIPDVCIKVFNINASARNSSDKLSGHLDIIECNVKDLSKCQARRRQEGQVEGETAEERKMVIDLGSLLISSDLPSATASLQSLSLSVEGIKVEAETKLTMNPPHDDREHCNGAMIVWNTRCTGDVRGLSVSLAEDLAPWIKLAFSPEQLCTTPLPAEQVGGLNDSVWDDIVSSEMQIQLKFLRSDVVCLSRRQHCNVLPNGVPDIGLSIDEVTVFMHPFIDEEPLGVRAKADLQASRLKMYYAGSGRLSRSSFLSIDFVRVLIEPVSALGSDFAPAEVEMEAEWLEVRWTPEAMLAIGGLLELGITVFAPLLDEQYDWTSDDHWDPRAPERVPHMRPMSDVVEDHLLPSEAIKFRCRVKRSLVLFSHSHDGHNHVDYVTVDTLNMSLEETTGRFRLFVSNTKVCNVEGASDLDSTLNDPLIQQKHRAMRRRPSTLPTKAKEQLANRSHTGHRARVEAPPFFCVKLFALEENRLPQCPMKVLDLFVDGVSCTWDMTTQERIVELIRRVTFSAWEMLYRMRSAYGQHCTSLSSRYNRQGGLNGVITDANQCDDAERLLSKLISAGGDTLNRIHATDIGFRATFCDQESSFDLQVHVGLFESEDLPELWLFERVSITLGGSLKLLDVDRVQVRHTVNKRRDYVFGFFEEALRLRQIACGKLSSNISRIDGMMIDIEGLRVGLSLQTDLVQLAGAIYGNVSPLLSSHLRSFTTPWRPQDEDFYRFFLRIPNTRGQPRIWLQLSNVQVESLDQPMEAWLEHVYPLWIEELAEQELRSQLLHEQVTALKLINSDLPISEATDEMKTLLHEKSSRIYTHKVRRLQESFRNSVQSDPLHTGAILSLRISCVCVDVFSEPHEQTVSEMIRRLDEATPVVEQSLLALGMEPSEWEPRYAFLLHQHIDVRVLDTSVRMRSFSAPVAVVDELVVGGHVIIAAAKSPDTAADTFALTGALRCFADINVSIQRPTLCFAPAYAHAMLELAVIVERVLPSLVLDVDRVHESAPWDIARRLLHGKLHLQMDNTAVRLLASSNSFEVGDYLEVGVQRVDVKCHRGEDAATDISIDRLTVKVEPEALVNIAEITSVTLHSKATWTAARNASVHYFLPIEFCKKGWKSTKDVAVVDFQEGRIWHGGTVKLASRLGGYSGTSVSVSMAGKVAPKTPAEQMTRRDIASRSAIVLYTKHVEWLIQFGWLYLPLTQLKYPLRSRRVVNCSTQAQQRVPQMDATLDRFLRVFRGIVIEDFAFIGLDVALYHSEKSQVGLRACINDKIAFSASVNTSRLENALPKSSQRDSLRQVSIEWNGSIFAIDRVSLAVSDVQVRICTPSTGSRGESLVSIRDVCLNVGGGSTSAAKTQESFDFATLHSELVNSDRPTELMPARESNSSRMSSFKSLSTSPPMPVEKGKGTNEVLRAKSKINILEHFAIQQHNPYHYRDDNGDEASLGTDHACKETAEVDKARTSSRSRIQAAFVEDFRRQGFLLGLSACEIRVLVTLDTVETLVEIVENWVHVIRASTSELYRVPDEILKPTKGQDVTETYAAGLESPKKSSSLADDPKFGPIFHASNPIPSSRHPSFSVETPNEGGLSDTAQLSPTSRAGVVRPFLTVRFMDCQINFQDHQNKGSVLLALSRGTVRHSRSQDVQHELVDLNVDGVQLFTSPLDIDVRSRVVWLRTMEDGFTYCPSSYGLLKHVVAPIPAKAVIWIDRNIVTLNRVEITIPSVEISVNIDSKNILEKLGLALVGVVTAKLADYQAPDYSKMLQAFRGSQNQVNIQSSLKQLLLARKQLKWNISELHWRHTCRWNYRVNERANFAMQALEGARSYNALDFDPIPSPFLHGRRLSATSLPSSIGTSLMLSGSTPTHTESASDELQHLQQQHDSIGEVIRSLVAAELLKRQLNPNVQLTFTLHSASLTLSAANSDIVSAAMTNLIVKLNMYEDQSGTFALTIQDVCCRNLCPNTPYPELLIPLKNSKAWSGDDMFVRVDAEVAPPIAGVKIVRHFEINVHPMQVCLTYDLILQLVAFFTSVSGPTLPQEEKKAQVRAQFLAAPQLTRSSNGEGLLRKAAKVAGKAAHPLTHGRRHRADSNQDQRADPRVKAMQELQEEATQWISRVARAHSNTGEDNDASAEIEAPEMRDRTNNDILFKRIRLGTVEVMVSFKNKKTSSSSVPQALEDMRGFEVKIHSLVYSDKTCSLIDLLLRIRRDVILDVLSQVGRNFTNVASFLRDQLDITRWGTFDALAPLKSLSTAIVGSSQAVMAPGPSPANAPSTPSGLSVEMLERSPRVSHDVSSSSTISTSVDSSKVFQLELPENHPSRRKKHSSQSRPTELVSSFMVPFPSPRREKEDAETASTAGVKPKKKLSMFFGKSKKTLQTPASIAEDDETAS